MSIVQLSMFFFVVVVSCDSFYIISKRFMFVNNFFNLFFVLHLKHLFLVHQLIYNNIPFSGCQALFSTFFTFSWSAFYIQAHVYCRSMLLSFEQNGERGIRTLAPLLTTYSLSRGAPSASLGISPKRPVSNIHDSFLFVQYFFLIFQNGHLALEYSIFCFRKSLSFFLSGSKKNILFSVYNTFRKFLHDFTENKKECASAHSRAERVAERQWRSLSNDRSGA